MNNNPKPITKFQYSLLKTFLDGFKVKPEVLARKWGIQKGVVLKVSLSPNYEMYVESVTGHAFEDVMSGMFG